MYRQTVERQNSAAKRLTAVYDAVYSPGVGKHVSSRVIPVRLKNELADEIDAQAEASDMSRNEFIVRRLRKSLRAAPENRKTVEIDRDAEELPPLEEDE